MTDEEKVGELLLEWQRLQEWGQDVSPSVLCGDRTNLVPLLTDRIARLRWTGVTPDEANTPSPGTELQPLEPENPPAPNAPPANLRAGRSVISARNTMYIVCCLLWFGSAGLMIASREKVLAPQFFGIGFVACWVVTMLWGIVANAGAPPESEAKQQ